MISSILSIFTDYVNTIHKQAPNNSMVIFSIFAHFLLPIVNNCHVFLLAQFPTFLVQTQSPPLLVV